MRIKTFVIWMSVLVLIGLITITASATTSTQHQADPISGQWEASFTGPQDMPAFTRTLKLKLDAEKVTGTFESEMGSGTIKGSWAESKLKLTLTSERGAMEFTASLKDGKLIGEWDVGHVQGKVEAKKK